MDTENHQSYEDIRKQRLEENKKRMQELGLADLTKTLASGFTPSKSPANRQVRPRAQKETVLIELRRSSRVAGNPQPDYREVEVSLSLGRRSYARSSLFARKYASDEARMEAANKAESLLKALPSNNASFVKPMLQSHVTGGFWLGLPSMFCKIHLSKRDDMIVLEDEKGEEWETVYLANKTGLSGGWRGFSLDHGLVDGDALVFELVEPSRFKVYIVRASDTETDLEDENHTFEETDEKTNDAADKGEKRRQRLVKEKLDANDGANSDERHQATTVSTKKGSKKKNQMPQEAESELGEAEAGIGKYAKRKIKSKGKKPERVDAERVKKRAKETTGDDEIDVLFEEDGENESNDSKKVDAQQLTSVFRSKKPHSSTSRASRKPMLRSGGMIEVY